MMKLVRAELRAIVAALCLLALAPLARAAWVPMAAVMNGQSTIVEVIDPAVPLLRVETQATGTGQVGPISLLAYRSGDIVNFATGAGNGQNVFTSDNGDELFGDFDVQLIPAADPGAFQLIGQVSFTGGNGRFAGAFGSADFTGLGQFIDAAHALTRFEFVGRVNLVPAPATASLLVLGLLVAGLRSNGLKLA